MWHTGAYQSSIAQNSLLQLTPAADPLLTILSNGYVILPQLPYLGIIHANSANIVALQLNAPSLRALVLPDISPLNRSATPAPPFRIWDRSMTPLQMVVNEFVIVAANQNSAGAQIVSAFLYFFDAPVVPATGRMFSVRCTGTTTLTANAWTLVPLTFTQLLPAGLYQCVGMQAQSAGALAARLVFVGQAFRPGVPGSIAAGDMSYLPFREGLMGNMGYPFPHNLLPSVEFWSLTADTTEEVYLDLIKIQ